MITPIWKLKTLKTAAVALVLATGAMTLAGCSTSPDYIASEPMPVEKPVDRSAANWFAKYTFVCFWNDMSSPLSLTFGKTSGNFSYPYTVTDGSSGKGGPLKLSRGAWACSSNDAITGFTAVDVPVTIVFPDGRSTILGITNPAIGAPEVRPAMSSQGMADGYVYEIPENKPYVCDVVGWEFTVKQLSEVPNYKRWEVVFTGPEAPTDDFSATLCRAKS